MNDSRGHFSRDEGHSLSRVSILVIGAGPFWTQHPCGLIENEFDTACLRVDSIDRASSLAPGHLALRLVIVDQSHAEDLLSRSEEYFGLGNDVAVALAYRQPDIARHVHRHYDDRFGPMGYVPMNVPFEVWLSSIRLLLHGEHFLPSDLRASAEVPVRPAEVLAYDAISDVRLRVLTDREREVLRLASAGDSNKIISRKLAISEHTVKLHMHHVYEKLGVSNRTAAASLLLGTERRP